MARSFTEAITAFRTKTGQPWLDAVEIYNLLKGLGANSLETNTLLGIAAAESVFDFNAVGSLGEWGAWQIEKEEEPSHEQASNALKAMRETIDDLNAGRKAPLDQVVDQDVKTTQKIVRAAWQRGAKKKDACKRWLNDVKARWTSLRDSLKKSGMSNPDQAATKQLTSDGTKKLGADDFINWSATKEDSNRAALDSGQDAFKRFMDSVGWAPTAYTSGTVPGDSAQTTKEEIGIATDSALKAPGVWLKDAIAWGFDNIREGGKELVYQTTRTVLPPAMLILGGYALYKALSKSWSKGKKS
jgi:hypothetical protein